MMRSMFSGVSGLRVHQTKMDVIANNIANVNTIGYKSSRTTFAEVFSQTLSGASRATENRGGTNPTQVGLGVKLGSIDMIMTTGIPQRTDWAYDLMIDGAGFFIVSDANGTYFTRAGNFRIDLRGNVTNDSGMFVNGWMYQENPDYAADPTNNEKYIVVKGPSNRITIGPKEEYLEPTPTSSILASGNLDPYMEPNKTTTMNFIDALGNNYTITARYVYDPDNKCWNVFYGSKATVNGVSVRDNDPEAVFFAFEIDGDDVKFKVSNTKQDDFLAGQIYFNDAGKYVGFFLDNKTPTIDAVTGLPTDGEEGFRLLFDQDDYSVMHVRTTFGDPVDNSITVAFNSRTSGLTQFYGYADATYDRMDGNQKGTLSRITIAPDGTITGSYSNGETRPIAKIALANFKNPAGLLRVGSNLFVETRNSGDFDGIGVEADAIGTTIMGGVLEMSNVDLGTEFTEMITTQRGFQANSRIITVSDEILQELVNLKR